MADIPTFEEFKKTQGSTPTFAEFKAQQSAANPSDAIPKAKPPVPEELAPAKPNFLTSPTGFIRSGFNRAVAGVEHMAEPGITPKIGGASEVLRGAGSMLAPVAIGATLPSLFAAPASTMGSAALGTAGSMAGGAAAKSVAKSFHASPEAQNLTEDIGGLVGGGAGAYSGARAPELFKTDPRIAVTRAIRPTPSNPDFSENIPRTLSAIKASNPGFKPRVENGELNLIPAAQRAIQAHQDALQPWLQRMEGTRVSGDPIIEATRNATRGMLPSETQSGNALVDRAHQDYGDGFSPQELRDRLSLLNDRLRSFYSRTPGSQSSVLADIPDAVLKAQRDAASDSLYRHLDPENEGAGPRLIQSRTGDLIDLRDAAVRRNNAIVAEQPLTPFGKVFDPIKGAIRHLLPTGKSNAGLAFAEGSEGRSLPLLRRAFNASDETEGANELGSLPRPGPRLLESGDTSGAISPLRRDAMAVGSEFYPKIKLLGPASRPMGSGVTAPDFAGEAKAGVNRMNAGPKQLPAATSPIGVSGTIVPDIIGTSSRGKGGPIGLLPAPEPGRAPVNILPRGPGAIGPTGTVPEFSYENPIPLGGIKGGRLLDYLKRGPRLPE